MLLKEAKLMLDQMHMVSVSEDVNLKWSVDAIYKEEHGGFVILVIVGNNNPQLISSHREEVRVFKTLDALYRAVQSVGITNFSVFTQNNG